MTETDDAAQDTAVILGREQGRLAEEADAAAAAATRAAAVLQVSPQFDAGAEAVSGRSQVDSLVLPCHSQGEALRSCYAHGTATGLLSAASAPALHVLSRVPSCRLYS